MSELIEIESQVTGLQAQVEELIQESSLKESEIFPVKAEAEFNSVRSQKLVERVGPSTHHEKS